MEAAAVVIGAGERVAGARDGRVLRAERALGDLEAAHLIGAGALDVAERGRHAGEVAEGRDEGERLAAARALLEGQRRAQPDRLTHGSSGPGTGPGLTVSNDQVPVAKSVMVSQARAVESALF